MSQIDDTEHFGLFAKVVENAIAKYGALGEEDVKKLQKAQVEELAQLERKFQAALAKDKNGKAAYEVFFDYILGEKRNVLAARPYFRERRDHFASVVSKAIKERDVEALRGSQVNYHFVNLVIHRATFGKRVADYAAKIIQARQNLVIMNLPLVISRARIFWGRTQRSHNSFMDLIQIGVEGLLSGVDKYCGEYSRMWCGVAIGRISGNLIAENSSTMVHFYPGDKRKIYAAKKFLARHIKGGFDEKEMEEELKKSFKGKVDMDEILGLVAASAIVSADSTVVNEAEDTSISDIVSRTPAPESTRPDVQVEANEAQHKLSYAVGKLPLFDKKLLRLKGIDIPLGKT